MQLENFYTLFVHDAIIYNFDDIINSLMYISDFMFPLCSDTQPAYGATSNSSSKDARKVRRTQSIIYCVHGKVASDCCDLDQLKVKTVKPEDGKPCQFYLVKTVPVLIEFIIDKWLWFMPQNKKSFVNRL